MPTPGKLELSIKINQVPSNVKTIPNGWKQFEIDTSGQIVTLTLKPEVFKQLEEAPEKYSQWVAVIAGQISKTDGAFLLKNCSVTVHPLETLVRSYLPNTELQTIAEGAGGAQKEEAGEQDSLVQAFSQSHHLCSPFSPQSPKAAKPVIETAYSYSSSAWLPSPPYPSDPPSPKSGQASYRDGVELIPSLAPESPLPSSPAAQGALKHKAPSEQLRLRSKTSDTKGLVFIRKLIQGLGEFQANYFSTHSELFEQLSHGQKPQAVFITCSDSRIDPNLMTQTQVGELFFIRNAGNIIPPFGGANSGEGAALEFAIQGLGIEQIIVCGHSHCGAVKGLLQLGNLQEQMPLVHDWLRHAEATQRVVKENYSDYEGKELLEIAIAENVLRQIEHLKSYPFIRSKLNQGQLQIYGWIYRIETGEVLAYDPISHTYVAPQCQVHRTEI